MFRSDLVDLINRGTTWAFIGSGLSARAGMPTWEQLAGTILARLDGPTREVVLRDGRYAKWLASADYPRAINQIERVAGRDVIEETTRALMSRHVAPDEVHRIISDWPFAGVITSNYDHLIERAFADARLPGWTPVGNTQNELSKVRTDAGKVIWHIHGSAELEETKSKLIITSRDYDNLYLGDSPVVETLRSLIMTRRMVFIGFGMQDQEIMRILRRAGLFASPATPIFAIISSRGGGDDEATRQTLREENNVEVIPYRVVDESHARLADLLTVYNAFILRRTLHFGQTSPRVPSYDPETTGLMLFNEFCLQRRTSVPEEVVVTLLKARTLSLLSARGAATTTELANDLSEQARLIATPTDRDLFVAPLSRALSELQRSGLVTFDEGTSVVTLATDGQTRTENAASRAELLRDQFRSSLQTRVIASSTGLDADAIARISTVAEAFIQSCIDDRALGVALSSNASGDRQRQYHLVALFQALPSYLERLGDADEALVLIRVIQLVFANPTQEERTYIGASIQAKFGVHLLGYDAATLQQRLSELSSTLFIIDANTLIPFLARSSVAHDAARLMIQKLTALGSRVVTTTLLAHEVAEHAAWALKAFDEASGRPNEMTYQAASGRFGRANAFHDGFLTEYRNGRTRNFHEYLADVTGCRVTPNTSVLRDDDVIQRLRDEGITVVDFREWDGFTEELAAEKATKASEIAAERKSRHTFRHDRQTEAEAEALIIVEGLRARVFRFDGAPVGNAYFVSPTRVIDSVASTSRAITMRPEGVLQWISTLSACSVEELGTLTDVLLAEIETLQFKFVDPGQLEVTFSPLINAARERLEEEREKHRALLSDRYGTQAFENVSPTDAPIVLKALLVQEVQALDRALAESEKARRAIAQDAKMTSKERLELAKLREKSKEKGKRNRNRRRRKKRK